MAQHMIRTTFLSATLGTVFLFGISTQNATGQDVILAQMYGRGVHAYNSGNLTEANRFLSAAINGGTKDPRAYYFRGIVASSQGLQYQAESDWATGAKLEATTGSNPDIGRSLSRFQGSARLKLEQARAEGRLQHMIRAGQNSAIRTAEIQSMQPPATVNKVPMVKAPMVPGSSNPIADVNPPPAPAVADNPFADDPIAKEPMIEADDALAGANKPLGADPTASAAPAATGAVDVGSPFGGGPAAGGADPFGGGGAPAAGGADPFGGGPAPVTDASDPFGGGAGGGAPAADPFGGGSTPAADPFSGDPFGN